MGDAVLRSKFRFGVMLWAVWAGVLLSLACPAPVHSDAIGPDSRVGSADSCLSNPDGKTFLTRRFALEGRCKRLDDARPCAYHDFRKLNLSDIAGFDQRGIQSYQVTFPGTEHLFAALSVRNEPGSRFCWVGGAHVGQNPMAMTWGWDTGTKRRKNNFILSESGLVEVDSARIHNLHDIFMADSPDAGFDVRHSWITWNRDDVFEGYLQNLTFSDTLIDGTYTFISDPDGECDDDKKASDRNILIEDSLIRLQRQPGPYGRQTPKWHWAVEGGHNTLWKLDSCDWNEWPTFTLRNNVFLIEGPRTTFKKLNSVDCRLALPGDCADSAMSNLRECSNNLFLYSHYEHWRKAGSEPGPVPRPGSRFYNADNPSFLPNGTDCYQRLTDDIPSIGSADVKAVWNAYRQRWIDRHTAPSRLSTVLMQIPGVDFPVFMQGSRLRIINRKFGDCLTSDGRGHVSMQPCEDSAQQLFSLHTVSDGKLMAAVLLADGQGHFLRSDATEVLDKATSPEDYQPVFKIIAPDSDNRAFEERWYILPLGESIETSANDPVAPVNDNEGFFYIESDGLQRSFLLQTGSDVRFQALFAMGIDTPLPQDRFTGGNDHALQWRLHVVE